MSVVSTGVAGFLPSTDAIEVGRVVPSTFVCMNGDRALFTFAFTMGTSARVQHSTASDQENAFSVWADAFPSALSLRRAVDVVMPPLDSSAIMLKLNEKTAREVLPPLAETNFTGCLKVYCQSAMSRAALIFLNGRIVGAIYTKKPIPDPYPFELGIKKLLQDLCAPDADADLEMYELPRSTVLSMSSLFLGYVDNVKSKLEHTAYAKKMFEHFSASKETACFNLLDKKADTPIMLGFVCDGEFTGAYAIAERIFSAEKNVFLTALEKNPKLKLQAHILPAAMMTDAVCFGYSLNSEQFAFI